MTQLALVQNSDLLSIGKDKINDNDLYLENLVNSVLSLGYIHEQPSPSETWEIEHNIGTRVLASTVINNGGLYIEPQQTKIVDENTVELTFGTPVEGTAFFVFGKAQENSQFLSFFLDRANHVGTQPIDTIEGLNDELADIFNELATKADDAHVHDASDITTGTLSALVIPPAGDAPDELGGVYEGDNVIIDADGRISVQATALGDANFVFTQSSSSTQWVIDHGLGKYPSVEVVDATSDPAVRLIPDKVTYTSVSQVVVEFINPQIGRAFLN